MAPVGDSYTLYDTDKNKRTAQTILFSRWQQRCNARVAVSKPLGRSHCTAARGDTVCCLQAGRRKLFCNSDRIRQAQADEHHAFELVTWRSFVELLTGLYSPLLVAQLASVKDLSCTLQCAVHRSVQHANRVAMHSSYEPHSCSTRPHPHQMQRKYVRLAWGLRTGTCRFGCALGC